MKFFVSLFLFFLVSASLVGQSKFEREFRISPEKIPNSAIQLIDQLQIKKGKWYEEHSNRGVSYEFKGLKDKNQFSIEFDTLGNLEDVEIKIAYSRLSEDIKQKINQHLDEQFGYFKIYKCQIQLLPSPELVQSINESNWFNVHHNFEVLVKGKSEKNIHLFEFLFDSKGGFVHSSRMKLRNTDNIEF